MILFQPTPSFQGVVNGADFICSEWFAKYNDYCTGTMGSIDRREWLEHVSMVTEMHEEVARTSYNNIFVFDPFPYLCPEGVDKCPRKIDGKMLYYDDDHLSEFSSERIFPEFVSFLRNSGIPGHVRAESSK